MKLSRQLAGGAAAALVGLIALPLSAATASAQPTEDMFEYVEAQDLVMETTPYPVDRWFIVKGSTGTAATSEQGTILDGANGPIQIMRTPLPGEGSLSTMVNQRVNMSVASGSATFQVFISYDHDANPTTPDELTTLYPSAKNEYLTKVKWKSSRQIINTDGTEKFAAQEAFVFDELQEALKRQNVKILAFGAAVDSGEKATLIEMTFERLKSGFARALHLNPILPRHQINSAELLSSGVEVLFEGLPAYQEMTIQLKSPNLVPGPDNIVHSEIFRADATGSLRAFVKPKGNIPNLVGDWVLIVSSSGHLVRVSIAEFTVVNSIEESHPQASNPVKNTDGDALVLPAAIGEQDGLPVTLPATGADASITANAAITAIALTILGLALGGLSRRRLVRQ